MTDVTRMAVVILLVVTTGVFTIAEYALLTARQWHMRGLADGGSRRAAMVLRLIDEPLRFIATIQLGISALGILVGAVGATLLHHLFHPPLPAGVSFALAIVAMTFLSVLIGDLVPKAIALQQAERLSLWLAPAIVALERVAFPIVWLLQVSATALLRPLGLRPTGLGTRVRSEQDLRGILAEAEQSGVIEEAEEEMLYGVFDFATAETRQVMVARAQIDALAVELTVQQALVAVLESPHTRHPVFDGDLDHVVGILYLRDLFTAVHNGSALDGSIRELLGPARLVSETESLGALLAELQRTSQRMAIVVDEDGITTGIVTLEDLLEEIVGEIATGYDLPDESVAWIDDRTVRVAGSFPVDDFNTRFGVALPDVGFHTLAGLAFDALGRVAVVGDELHVAGLRMRVLAIDGPRIRTLEMQLAVAASSTGGTRGAPRRATQPSRGPS